MALKNKCKISEKYSKSKSSFALHIILKKKNYNTSQSIKENIFLLPNVKFIFVMLNEKRINVVFVIYLCMIPFLIYLLFFTLKINMNLYQHAMNVSSMNYFLISSLLITSFNLHSYMKLKFDYSDLSDNFFKFITNEK